MKISNIILLVSDVDHSLRFYVDEMGLTLVGRSGEFAFIDGGGVTLALRQVEDLPPTGATEVVFEVDDVDAYYAECRARGVDFRVEPRTVTSDGDRELHAADCTDPDGHVLSITGWVPTETRPPD